MNKYYFIFDKIEKNIKLKKFILKKYTNYLPQVADAIIVLGGDGFMLKTLKKYQKYNKPFYGVNRGTFGFLMNKFRSFDVLKNINNTRQINITPLEIKAITKNKKSYSAIAINEVSLLRQSKQTASIRITIGKKILIKKLVCDGVLISTPAGSTAYNLSVGGPILSINSKKLAVTPISPFRPRRWKGKIVSSSSKIKVENLNTQKRPVSIVADNVEFRNIKNINVKINNNLKFKLLYDKTNALSRKIKLEQRMKK